MSSAEEKLPNLKQQIRDKHAINAYAVRNEVSQRITEKAIQHPDATKKEAEMMEHLIYEQLNYVRIKDVLFELDKLADQLRKHIADLEKDIPKVPEYFKTYLKRVNEILRDYNSQMRF